MKQMCKWWRMNTMNMYIKPWSVYYTVLVSHPTENYWQGSYNPKTGKTTPPLGKHRRWWRRINVSLRDHFERSLYSNQKRKEPMNEEFPNTGVEAQLVVAAPLTDEQIETLLAGGLAIVDADEVSEDPEVTVH